MPNKYKWNFRIMNKFSGLLDFPEFEDQEHRLEVKELLLREDGIAFSMKWAYGAGNSDSWSFEGVAKKEGSIYVTQNVIGKKYQGSLGDDDGNDIYFKKVSFNHEFGDLEVEGTIKYKAQNFDFDGILEQEIKDFSVTQIISISKDNRENNTKVRNLRSRHNRKNELFFIQTEIEDLPVHFRAYVKANRVFLATIKQYQDVLKGLNLAQNFISWSVDCQKKISHFERELQSVIDGVHKLHVFNDEKKDIAHQLEEILDSQPKEIFFCTDNLNQDQIELINNTDEYFYKTYQKIRDNGYIVYDTWLDTMPLL